MMPGMEFDDRGAEAEAAMRALSAGADALASVTVTMPLNSESARIACGYSRWRWRRLLARYAVLRWRARLLRRRAPR